MSEHGVAGDVAALTDEVLRGPAWPHALASEPGMWLSDDEADSRLWDERFNVLPRVADLAKAQIVGTQKSGGGAVFYSAKDVAAYMVAARASHLHAGRTQRDVAAMPACDAALGDEHHLYALEIHEVGTKVGITRSPKSRITSLVKAARSHRRATGRLWLTYPHIEAEANEQWLVGWHFDEYLPVSFDDVLRVARELPMTRYAGAFAAQPRMFDSVARVIGT